MISARLRRVFGCLGAESCLSTALPRLDNPAGQVDLLGDESRARPDETAGAWVQAQGNEPAGDTYTTCAANTAIAPPDGARAFIAVPPRSQSEEYTPLFARCCSPALSREAHRTVDGTLSATVHPPTHRSEPAPPPSQRSTGPGTSNHSGQRPWFSRPRIPSPFTRPNAKARPPFNDRHSHKDRRDVISFFTSNLFACSRAPPLQTLGRISLPFSPTNVIPRDGAVGLPGARQNPNRRGESSRAGAGRDSCGQTRADIEGEAGGAVRRAAVPRVHLDNGLFIIGV